MICPPNDKEKLCYIENHKNKLFVLGVFSFLLLSAGMVIFSLSNPSLYLFLLVCLANFVYLSVSYFIMFMGKPFDFEKYKKEIDIKYEKPTVDVFLPVCGEPYDVLFNTWKYVSEIKWPKELIKIHVLDDKKDPVLKDKAKEFGFNYITRENNAFKKAGNLKNAFLKTNGEFILVFDADFCPRSDFLECTIPLLIKDKSISILQTPQFFEINNEMNWLEKGAAYVQELFYRLIQVNRDTHNAAICVGSCAVYRRKALEDIGGPRQVEHSEDVWTGFTTAKYGWKVRYIPIPLSKGLCPSDLKSFFLQQYRWCSGSLSLGFSKEFWKSNLTVMQKLCYLSGFMYYIATGLGIFVFTLPSLIMLIFFPQYIFIWNAIFYVPSFIYGTLVIGLWSIYPFGLHYIKVRHISYYAHFFALKDRILKTVSEWVPTGAKKKNIKIYKQAKKLMFYTTSFVTLTTIFLIAYRIHDYPWYHFLPSFVFTLFHYYINMTVFRDIDD